MIGHFVRHAIPPDPTVIREGNVGEDRIFEDGGHGVRVGLLGSSRGDAKKSIF